MHLGSVNFNDLIRDAMDEHRATTVDLTMPHVGHLLADAARLSNPIHKLERLCLAYQRARARGMDVGPLLSELARVVPAIVDRSDRFFSDDIGRRTTGRGQYAHAVKMLNLWDTRLGGISPTLPGHLRAEYDRLREYLADQVAVLAKYV